MRILASLLLLLLATSAFAGRCTGKGDCRECVNCRACFWCRPVHQGKGLPPVRVRVCGVCAPSVARLK